jgi:multicomponent Na+:H+ antiporter subunit D
VNHAIPLLVLLPLVAAAVDLLAIRRPVVQRVTSIVALASTLVLAIALVAQVEGDDAALATTLGGWSGRIGITYVVDRLAGLMLVVALGSLLVVLVFAMGARARDERSPYYHPAYMVLSAGVAAAFVAGDLFHLFVAFEVLLTASYVLLTLEGRPSQIRSGTTYVVLNVVESLVLLMAVGLVYAATGTLSMADLPAALAELDPGVRTGLHLLLLIAFGIKAAVFPLFFWLPDAYPTAPSPVTAVFAGLLTKVGVYCLIRTQTLLFPGEARTLLLIVAGLTMIIGVLGAIAQSDIKRILSFHIVSQIGYMVFGLAMGGAAAIAATVFYVAHHIPVKTSLFLVEGIIERSAGTGTLDRIGGLARRSAPLALLFAVPALSLAGLPPFSGFLSKLGLILEGVHQREYALVAAALVGSLLTLVSMTKIWLGAFWGEPPADAADPGDGLLRRYPTMAGSTAALVAVTLAVAIGAGPLFGFCQRAADDLTTPGRYQAAVEEGP